MLNLIMYMERDNSEFIDWGTVPQLKPRGIQWLNACFWQLGEMVNEHGGWDAHVRLTEVRNEEGTASQSAQQKKP